MKAIPTKYANVQYRSILEARWAAFFDCIGLTPRPVYEPEAFAGYIPDFMWERRPGMSFVFEVKGALEQFDLQKIRRSGWSGDVGVLTGAGPFGAQGHHPRYEFSLAGYFVFHARASRGEPNIAAMLERCWREAGNLVQWRRP